MKTGRLILIALATLAITACSTQKEFYQFQGELLKQATTLAAKDKDLAIEREKTRQKQYDALVSFKDKLDAGGAAAFAVTANISTMAGAGGGSPQSDPVATLLASAGNVKPPEGFEDKAFKWAAFLLSGGRLVVDRLNNRDAVNAQRDTQLGLYSMIRGINADTGAAVVGGVSATGTALAPFAHSGPTTQNTVNVTDSQGVGILGGTASWAQPLTINVDCSSGAGAPGGAAAAGGPGAVTGATGGAGGGGGLGGSSGPVPCTVTRP